MTGRGLQPGGWPPRGCSSFGLERRVLPSVQWPFLGSQPSPEGSDAVEGRRIGLGRKRRVGRFPGKRSARRVQPEAGFSSTGTSLRKRSRSMEIRCGLGGSLQRRSNRFLREMRFGGAAKLWGGAPKPRVSWTSGCSMVEGRRPRGELGLGAGLLSDFGISRSRGPGSRITRRTCQGLDRLLGARGVSRGTCQA